MTVENKSQVFQQLAEHCAELQRFGVHRFGLFGSFVRGDQSVESDVDLLVEFKPGAKTFDNFMNLADFLEDIFGREVDLLTPESLNRHVKPRILREVEYATGGV